MKCKDCLELIEIFFDGELDRQNADSVSAHIAQCSSCADVYESLKDEQELYLNTASEVEVSPFFWAKVNERIEAEKTVSPLQRFAASFSFFKLPKLQTVSFAALCLFIVAISISAILLFTDSEKTIPSGDVAKAIEAKFEISNAPIQNKDTVKESAPLIKKQPKIIKASLVSRKNVETESSTSEGIATKAEKTYLEAIALLSRDISKRRNRLDPETEEQFKKTLAVVDRTIKNTRQAVRENPDDPVAVQYMLSAYSQKVDVLRGLISY